MFLFLYELQEATHMTRPGVMESITSGTICYVIHISQLTPFRAGHTALHEAPQGRADPIQTLEVSVALYLSPINSFSCDHKLIHSFTCAGHRHAWLTCLKPLPNLPTSWGWCWCERYTRKQSHFPFCLFILSPSLPLSLPLSLLSVYLFLSLSLFLSLYL